MNHQSSQQNHKRPPTATDSTRAKKRRFNPLKMVFAMEYVLQGLANPFQGITYQPFFRHFRYDYGLSEAATQGLFSKSYLAWSFKPIIGFLIDAYGRTKVILTALLSTAVIFYLLTPFVDRTYMMFFGFMFALSVMLAATDVAVDRATVIAGAEEAKNSGRSKATTVGLNQAICWAAIYGTSIFAAVTGGYVADRFSIGTLFWALALVPLAVLVFVLMLPHDKAEPIPLKHSVLNFWEGLNSGSVLWIMFFYFLFHFQPAMGALWNNHLLETLGFTQTEVGIADGASNLGLFLGVLLFAWVGVRWQERMGMKRLFKVFILLSIGINLTQYLLVDPLFSRITDGIAQVFPWVDLAQVRLGYLSFYNFLLAILTGIIRMSTFSLVGSVIPVRAAGSLFAGFMSVSNLAYSFSYASGAWLYEHGLHFGFMRTLQKFLFNVPSTAGDLLNINMLILIGSSAYLLSFLAAHMLPDRRETLKTAAEDDSSEIITPARPLTGAVQQVNRFTLPLMLLVMGSLWYLLHLDPVSAILLGFFAVTFLRRIVLDLLYKRTEKIL